MNILITGGRAPSALYFIRLFAKAGHNVYVADSNQYYLSMYSKYVTKSFVIPSPRFSYEKFVQDIVVLLEKYRIEMIIPTCEEVFYISKAKGQLSKYCHVFCDEFCKLIKLHNKFKFINYLEGIHVNCPKTMFCNNIVDLKEIVQKHFEVSDSKIVLKPVYSRFSSKVIILDNIRQIDQLTKLHISEKREWVIQEYIEGRQFCCYCVCKNGEILAYSDYDTIFTAGLGANIYFEYANNIHVRGCCEKIVNEMNFTGQIAFDFIIDTNGVVYPIECNPRATSGVHLFGYDNHLEKAFIANECVEISHSENWALKIILLFNWNQLYRRLHCLIHSNDVIYSKDDVKPAFLQIFILISNIFKAFIYKKSLIEITTLDIEFDGELNRLNQIGR